MKEHLFWQDIERLVDDLCGECGGDNSYCTGCMYSTACNYNKRLDYIIGYCNEKYKFANIYKSHKLSMLPVTIKDPLNEFAKRN